MVGETIMQNFEDIEELVSHMFEKLDGDEPVSVVADKDLAVNIMSELLTYDNVILSFANVDTYDYDKEYLVSLYDTDTDYWYVSIDQIYDDEKERYFSVGGYVLFHEDVNSKALIDMQNNKNIELSGYDWFTIGEEENAETENNSLTVNGKNVNIDEYNAFVSKFAPDKVKKTKDNNDNDTSIYNITIKGNLDMGDAEKIIEDMERRMAHMQEMIDGMIDDMNPFRRMFMW